MLLDTLSALDDKKLYDTDDVARFFQVPRSTVWVWVDRGWLEVEFRVKQGPMRFTKQHLLNFYHEMKQQSRARHPSSGNRNGGNQNE